MKTSLLVRTIATCAGLAGIAIPLAASADPAVAEARIREKANQFGGTGDAISGLELVRGGYRIRYQNCDIYYSDATGAHEVHGDIREKYNAKGGPDSDLGLPTTDETATPATPAPHWPIFMGGRYNHFSTNGSIYWHPNTGPMEVHGGIRWAWANQGWEQGPLGYPTTDERVVGPSQWVSEFQNGLLYWEVDGSHAALEASLSGGRVAQAVQRIFMANNSENKLYTDSVHVLDVSDTGYGFWESRNRVVYVRLAGHYRTPWPFSDSTWTMLLPLLFAADRDADGSMHLWVALQGGATIHTSGVGHGDLANGLKSGVERLFASRMGLGDIEAGAKPLSFKVMRDGGVTIYIQPHVENGINIGGLFQSLIQRKLDNFVDGF